MTLAERSRSAPPTRSPRSGRCRPWPRPTAPPSSCSSNFHRFLGSPEVAQALDTQLAAGKQARTFVVILSPIVNVPVELEKLFVLVEHDLPGRDQLEAIARSPPSPASCPRRRPGRRARRGGRHDPDGGRERLRLALVRHGRLDPGVIWDMKSGLEVRPPGDAPRHRDVRRPRRARRHEVVLPPRPAEPVGPRTPAPGILLGRPGTGKALEGWATRRAARPWSSTSARARVAGGADRGERPPGAAAGRREVPLRVWSTRSRRCWPASSGGLRRLGVSAGHFGPLLGWLNDRTSESFFVFTANDVSKLPPEFCRRTA